MKKIYKVTEECIACHACVEVADENFAMGSENMAFVKKQPENDKEISACEDAKDVCPVNAIVLEEQESKNENNTERKPILASSNVKEILDEYPQLKEVLVRMSDKFKKLLNPVMYNTLAKFASFKDAAKVTGISVCEILHIMNQAIGTIDELQKNAPECIKEQEIVDIMQFSEKITWEESPERYIYNSDTISEISEKISKLGEQENIVTISVLEPLEIVKLAKGMGFLVNVDKNREYRISIFNPKKQKPTDWRERKHDFKMLDVRTMQTDPFDIIIQQAYNTKEDDGFILIQRFEPFPMINMLVEMGFEYETEHISPFEVWVYFYKKSDENNESDENKTELVIQSATPVAYPVIMRLLQSDLIRKKVKVKQLKVWEETEKHLAWITNGKADISFSAVITSAKLRNSDVKIPALFVWDNFVMLTRYPAKDFNDIKGHEIHTPLFEEAPPAKITKYLMKASGYNPEDFKFVFGKPFGRPEQIYADFVTGIADTAILREPEASYAIKILQDRGEKFSIISFNELWNEINPGFGSFPNAGVVFKGEFYRNNPKFVSEFLKELEDAINWVNDNKKQAAELSFDMMRQPTDRIELFLERVNFNYVSGNELVKKVKDYFDVLVKENIVESEIDDEFFKIFES